MSGDRVTGYHIGYLYVPEWWRFEERQKQTQRLVLMAVFRVAHGLLSLALLIYLIVLAVRREALLLRVGGLIGSLLALLFVVTGLNFATLWWLRYDPAQPFVFQKVGRTKTLKGVPAGGSSRESCSPIKAKSPP